MRKYFSVQCFRHSAMKNDYLGNFKLQFHFLHYGALGDFRMMEYKGYQKMRS